MVGPRLPLRGKPVKTPSPEFEWAEPFEMPGDPLSLEPLPSHFRAFLYPRGAEALSERVSLAFRRLELANQFDQSGIAGPTSGEPHRKRPHGDARRLCRLPTG